MLLLCSQVNRSLYGAEDSSESWIRYLDHIDDKVQDGLFQLLLRSLHFLCDNMNPQVHTPGNTWEHLVPRQEFYHIECGGC